jgi:uncharacterized protein YggE
MSGTGALLFASSLALAVPVAAQDTAAIPSIVTSGEATVRRAPDQAFVTVAVESRSKNPREAQRLNAETMTAVQQRLLASGVAKEAVRTLGYSIQQEFDYPNGRRVPREFVARNALEVRVEPVDKAGDVIDAAVQAGATSVSGVRFELKDRAGAEREALRMAVADARGRADAVAAGAGRSVDRVLRIEEARPGMAPPPRPMMMARAAADASVETPVEPGTIEIRAQVTLTVSIK